MAEIVLAAVPRGVQAELLEQEPGGEDVNAHRGQGVLPDRRGSAWAAAGFSSKPTTRLSASTCITPNCRGLGQPARAARRPSRRPAFSM